MDEPVQIRMAIRVMTTFLKEIMVVCWPDEVARGQPNLLKIRRTTVGIEIATLRFRPRKRKRVAFPCSPAETYRNKQ
jgi:hypothetical protein